MKPKTRLDAVVKIRERDENRARIDLATAQRHAQAAEEALRHATARAREDQRGRGRAMDWELIDTAHTRALLDARIAEHAVNAASEKLGSSRRQYVGAYGRAEAMRRLVETRRADAIRESERAEAKVLDEIASLLFVRA